VAVQEYGVPTRADFEKLNAWIAEAVALCEAAEERFQQIHAELLKAISEGRRLTSRDSAEEDTARDSLFGARVELSKRLRTRRQLLGPSTDD